MRITELQQHHCSSIFKERYYDHKKSKKHQVERKTEICWIVNWNGVDSEGSCSLANTVYLYSRDRHVGPCNCENKTIAIVIMSVVHNRKTPQVCFLFHSKTEIKSKTYLRNMWLDLGLRSFKLWFRFSVVGEEIVQKTVRGSVQKRFCKRCWQQKSISECLLGT